MIDFNTLTLGEAAFLEDYTGLALSQFSDDNAPKTKFLIGMATITKRREGNPHYTTIQAELLTFDEVQVILGSDDADESPEVAEALGN